MNEQPTALRLADEHDNDDFIASTKQWREEAAAELRRQHNRIALLEATLWQAVEALDGIHGRRKKCEAAITAARQALQENT